MEMNREAKQLAVQRLRAQLERLEAELAEEEAQWPPRTYYWAYHVLAGFVIGMLAASTSLLFNIVGSLLVGQHPLQLIRVYLTFPLGAAALKTDNELALATGCCLYLATGMLLGIPFHLLLSRFCANSSFLGRLLVSSLLALALWLINYYAILWWLQPLAFGGDWIVREIPVWVAALTHLVFGWTMALAYPMGQFVPYGYSQETSNDG